MTGNEAPVFLIKKMLGMGLLLLGLIVSAVGFAAGAPSFGILGLFIAAWGVVLLALKIIRRNRGTDV
jgi:hypothetical protein